MVSDIVNIGHVPWKRQDMIDALEEFASLYRKRPLKDNTGGMVSPHMFTTWFALTTLMPEAVIESGVWLGQGTWLIEQACPSADLYCIDPNLKRIQYRSDRATYFDQDFSNIDWRHLPTKETVLFFDDHQNAYERVKTAHWFGFKNLIFEDNYPPLRGDCYSLKKAFMHTGFQPPPHKNNTLKTWVRDVLRKLCGLDSRQPAMVPKTALDAQYLYRNLEVYYEFPPIFRTEKTRWGDGWSDNHYPTPRSLLKRVEQPFQQLFRDEAVYYTWMCYARLK